MKELLSLQVKMINLRQAKAIETDTSLGAEPSNKSPRKEKENLGLKPVETLVARTPRKLETLAISAPPPKRTKTSPALAKANFLGIGARQAREAKSARKAASVGLERSSKRDRKMAHTGSGFALSQVVRLKYVKGFTQAVRTPCRLQDLE